MESYTEPTAAEATTADPTATTIASLTAATLLFLFGVGTGAWVLDALAGFADGTVLVGATPVVGVVAMTVLTALLVAFGWTLTIRGLSGLVRIVTHDGLGRY
jgi:hypothetical protein